MFVHIIGTKYDLETIATLLDVGMLNIDERTAKRLEEIDCPTKVTGVYHIVDETTENDNYKKMNNEKEENNHDVS